MKKSKIKLTFFGKLFLFFLILIVFYLLIILFTDSKNNNNYKVINSYEKLNNIVNNFIINSSESDSNIIKDIFADGMKLDDFLSVYNQKENYFKKSGNYSNINYDFDRQLHYSDIESMLKNMNNSDIAKLELIGKSVDNRNIYGIEVGKGDNVIFLDANIHAAETANTPILMRFLVEILNNYNNGDKDTISLLNNVKLAVIPCINPDGYEVYNFGIESLKNKNLWWYKNKDKYDFENIKSNANGVDINRNFPTQNAGLYYNGKSLLNSVALKKTTSKTVYYGGSSLGSEPETKAVMYFMLKHYKNTKMYINFHSQGRVIYAGKPNLSTEFNNTTQRFANDISNINNYLVHGLSSEEVGEGNDGSATDFMAELANGFKFSSKTLRLSSNKYIDNNVNMIYAIPSITLETITTYTRDISVYKNEYYNHGLRKMLFNLLNYK